jgi:hypothetical protein
MEISPQYPVRRLSPMAAIIQIAIVLIIVSILSESRNGRIIKLVTPIKNSTHRSLVRIIAISSS